MKLFESIFTLSHQGWVETVLTFLLLAIEIAIVLWLVHFLLLKLLGNKLMLETLSLSSPHSSRKQAILSVWAIAT